MGALGICVEKPADFAPALANALVANRPVIIDVATGIQILAPTPVSESEKWPRERLMAVTGGVNFARLF